MEPAIEVADQGPEGREFIPAACRPNGRPLLAVAYELSGTLPLYEVLFEDR